jgi:hypothetical protein
MPKDCHILERLKEKVGQPVTLKTIEIRSPSPMQKKGEAVLIPEHKFVNHTDLTLQGIYGQDGNPIFVLLVGEDYVNKVFRNITWISSDQYGYHFHGYTAAIVNIDDVDVSGWLSDHCLIGSPLVKELLGFSLNDTRISNYASPVETDELRVVTPVLHLQKII